MKNFEVSTQINQLVEGQSPIALINYLQLLHPADIGQYINSCDPNRAALLFRALRKTQAAETFAYIEIEQQTALLDSFTDKEAVELLDRLYVDDMVDMIEELPANVVARVLKLSTADTRATINQFLNYSADSAGSIMTAEYLRFNENSLVGDTIRILRQNEAKQESLYTLYVTDAERKLLGAVALHTLLLAKDSQTLNEIMQKLPVKAQTCDDKEEVMKKFSTYDLVSLPIVDMEDRLVGMITFDDVLDVVYEEATEDFEKMAAISPSEKPYLKSSVFEQAKRRLTWLMILMLSGMLNGLILERYETAFLAVPLLVSFIPMLTDTGGNAGSQSSTMIIRGMALDEIRFKNLLPILWKELRIATLVGIALAISNLARVYFFYEHNFALAATVSVTLIFTVLMAKVIGCVLPLLASRVKLDPAIMAAPLITTIVDAGALIIFFKLAQLILGL